MNGEEETSTLFVPEVGKVYINRNGYKYRCIGVEGSTYTFVSAVGWVFHVRGIRINDHGRIEWDYSFGGCFDERYIRI